MLIMNCYITMLNKATLKILLGLYTAKHRRFGYGFASADDNALKILEFADVVFNSFMDCPQMVGKFFHIRNYTKAKSGFVSRCFASA